MCVCVRATRSGTKSFLYTQTHTQKHRHVFGVVKEHCRKMDGLLSLSFAFFLFCFDVPSSFVVFSLSRLSPFLSSFNERWKPTARRCCLLSFFVFKGEVCRHFRISPSLCGSKGAALRAVCVCVCVGDDGVLLVRGKVSEGDWYIHRKRLKKKDRKRPTP